MPGTMSQADLVADLKSILNDSQDKFTDPDDFQRHLDIAARDLARVRSRTLLGELDLVAEQSEYAAPADMLQPKFPLWGTTERRSRQPWESNWPGRLPVLTLAEVDGVLVLYLNPAPSAAQIADLGATYKYWYFAAHSIGALAADTTVRAVDRPLLLIRAAAQSLTELAHHNVAKPVQLGSSGVGSMPKNGTPSALAEGLLKLFERMASSGAA